LFLPEAKIDNPIVELAFEKLERLVSEEMN
jgi:hypothetical protein